MEELLAQIRIYLDDAYDFKKNDCTNCTDLAYDEWKAKVMEDLTKRLMEVER